MTESTSPFPGMVIVTDDSTGESATSIWSQCACCPAHWFWRGEHNPYVCDDCDPRNPEGEGNNG